MALPSSQPDPIDYKKGLKHLVDTTPGMKTLPPLYVLSLPENPLLVDYASIPIIDLSGLSVSVQRRNSTVRAIGSACAEWGIFRVTNHGIEKFLMDEMVEVAQGFFDLSWEEKIKYASDDVMDPVRYGTSLNTSKKHDLHWRDYLRHFGHPIQNSFHLWPLNPPNYRNVTKKYLEEMWKLAMKLAGAISESLGLEEKYIEKSQGVGTQIIACNYYPPCPEPNRTLGLARHSDHGGLTILMENGVEGLQVKHDGNWVGVQDIPGTFLVNLGDYLEIPSNGRYKSVEHRAVVSAERTRISIAVGHGPELTTTLTPAPQLIDMRSQIKYKSITYKDYMRSQQSSAIRGKTPLQRLMINNTT